MVGAEGMEIGCLLVILGGWLFSRLGLGGFFRFFRLRLGLLFLLKLLLVTRRLYSNLDTK